MIIKLQLNRNANPKSEIRTPKSESKMAEMKMANENGSNDRQDDV